MTTKLKLYDSRVEIDGVGPADEIDLSRSFVIAKSGEAADFDLSDSWRDMIGQIYTQGSDILDPTWENIGGTGYKAYKFAIGKVIQIVHHLQHDIKLGTVIYLHVHWLSDGTDVNPVRWEITYDYAKGHNQANFAMTETTVAVEEAPPGTAFRHMTTEIAVPITDVNFEPDGIMLVRVERVSNGAVDNTDNIFVLTSDGHYQASRIGTLNRVPNFDV